MLKRLSKTAAMVGALSLATVPFVTTLANAQGTGTEPPKGASPSGGAGGGAMMKQGGAMKGGAMMKKPSKGGMMMKGHGKKM